jgi:hypothetical protein
MLKNEDSELLKVAMAPIERGGACGPIGFGKAVLNARKMILYAGQHDIGRYIGHAMLQYSTSTSFVYYLCPTCGCTPI